MVISLILSIFDRLIGEGKGEENLHFTRHHECICKKDSKYVGKILGEQ